MDGLSSALRSLAIKAIRDGGYIPPRVQVILEGTPTSLVVMLSHDFGIGGIEDVFFSSGACDRLEDAFKSGGWLAVSDVLRDDIRAERAANAGRPVSETERLMVQSAKERAAMGK